jgi:hypothetical protein
MCMQQSRVRPHHRWNWHGDEIIHDPIIPASRTLPGNRKVRGYRIDVREFLTSVDNAVVAERLAAIIGRLTPAGLAMIRSHAPRSFDFRRTCVLESFSDLAHTPRRRRSGTRCFDDWLFPEETLALGGGDCEDLAFLLAGLLEASGISPACIRVAFGSLVEHRPQGPRHHDHTWVMYLNEDGVWEILEPLVGVKQAAKRPISPLRGRHLRHKAAKFTDFEYIPAFVMNRQHLWRVRASREQRSLVDCLGDRSFWTVFAASVHSGIIDDALGGGQTTLDRFDLHVLKGASLLVDVDVLSYDPRDHFDFSYIGESWQLYEERLASDSLESFALAIHAISDFYAHTVYAEFANRRADGSLELYDPNTFDASGIRYKFAPYAPLPGADRPVQDCEQLWKGQLISGQWWRWYTTFPDDLQDRKDFPEHRCLPDHDLIAVDSNSQGHGNACHRYFGQWGEQYALRYAAAVEHVRDAYDHWKM